MSTTPRAVTMQQALAAFQRSEFVVAYDACRAVLASLERGRGRVPLFDAAAFARHLEAAYEAMIARHDAGLPPAPLDIAST